MTVIRFIANYNDLTVYLGHSLSDNSMGNSLCLHVPFCSQGTVFYSFYKILNANQNCSSTLFFLISQ